MDSELRLVNVTTTQRDALTADAGDAVYNTTTGREEVYDGFTWQPGTLLAEAPAADLTAEPIAVVPGTYGESIVPGDALYFKSDGKWWKAKADVIATAPCEGLALETASSGTHRVLLQGIFRKDAWAWTVGGLVYLDASTSGGLTQTQPSATDQVIQIVGRAWHADRIYFNPGYDYATHT